MIVPTTGRLPAAFAWRTMRLRASVVKQTVRQAKVFQSFVP
jgi:hypothetical protein